MSVRRILHDPIGGKSYEYTTSEREEHLFSVLRAALANQCPPDNADYLCEKPESSESSELLQCAECYRQWAAKVLGIDTPKAKLLLQAIELTSHDQCPAKVADMLCKAGEDESTDEETCALCIERWATLPFATDTQ